MKEANLYGICRMYNVAAYPDNTGGVRVMTEVQTGCIIINDL